MMDIENDDGDDGDDDDERKHEEQEINRVWDILQLRSWIPNKECDQRSSTSADASMISSTNPESEIEKLFFSSTKGEDAELKTEREGEKKRPREKEKGNGKVIELRGLNEREKRKLIQLKLTEKSKKLDWNQEDLIVESQNTNNAMFLVSLLEQLGVSGSHSSLDNELKEYTECVSLYSLYSCILDRWLKNSVSPDLLKSILCLLYFTKTGFYESELISIVSLNANSTPSPFGSNDMIRWTLCFEVIKPYLVNKSDLFILSNPYLRRALARKFGLPRRQSEIFPLESTDHNRINMVGHEYHQKIAAYFQTKFRDATDNKNHIFLQRRIEEYGYHLLNNIGSNQQDLEKFLLEEEVFRVYYGKQTNRKEFLTFWKRTKNQNSKQTPGNTIIEKYQKQYLLYSKTNNDNKLSISSQHRKNILLKFKLQKHQQQETKNCETEVEQEIKAELEQEDQRFSSLTHLLANFFNEMGDPKAAISLLTSILPSDLENFWNEEILNDLAIMYEKAGSLDEARKLAERVHAISVQKYGPQHFKTADGLWLLAFIQKKHGNFAEAANFLNQAIGIIQDTLGKSHWSVGKLYSMLGDIHRKQAKYDTSKQYYHQALKQIYSAFATLAHPLALDIMDNIALIFKKEGKYLEAERAYQQARIVIEQLYEKDHLKVAENSLKLADVYRKMNRFDEAEDLYLQALTINRAKLGDDNIETAETYNSLALIQKVRGKLQESEENIVKAQNIIGSQLGDKHIKYAEILTNLADVYSIKAQYDQAVSLYRIALTIFEAQLGPDHPEVSEVLNALGMIGKKRGDYDEAEKYYRRALEIIEKIYGPEHPKVAMYTHNLGVACRKKKKFSEAILFYERAKQLNVKCFGTQFHSLVAQNINGIAMTLAKMNRLDEAKALYDQSLAIFEKTLGYDHEKVALTLNLLAEIMRKNHNYSYDGPEQLYLRALDINQKSFGSSHPEIAENLNGLGQVYKNQFKYQQADELFARSIEMTSATVGKYHPHTLNRIRNRIDNYERWGKVKDATELATALAKLKEEAKTQKHTFCE